MTTKRKSRSKYQTGTLKTFLAVGSMVATLAGTHLLAAQDTAVVDTAVPSNTAMIVVVPADGNNTNNTLPLPPTNRGTQIQLKQIPQVVQPQIRPVVRAHSSR